MSHAFDVFCTTWLITSTIETIPLKHQWVQESVLTSLAIECLQRPRGLSIMTALALNCCWVFWLTLYYSYTKRLSTGIFFFVTLLNTVSSTKFLATWMETQNDKPTAMQSQSMARSQCWTTALVYRTRSLSAPYVDIANNNQFWKSLLWDPYLDPSSPYRDSERWGWTWVGIPLQAFLELIVISTCTVNIWCTKWSGPYWYCSTKIPEKKFPRDKNFPNYGSLILVISASSYV